MIPFNVLYCILQHRVYEEEVLEFIKSIDLLKENIDSYTIEGVIFETGSI